MLGCKSWEEGVLLQRVYYWVHHQTKHFPVKYPTIQSACTQLILGQSSKEHFWKSRHWLLSSQSYSLLWAFGSLTVWNDPAINGRQANSMLFKFLYLEIPWKKPLMPQLGLQAGMLRLWVTLHFKRFIRKTATAMGRRTFFWAYLWRYKPLKQKGLQCCKC